MAKTSHRNIERRNNLIFFSIIFLFVFVFFGVDYLKQEQLLDKIIQQEEVPIILPAEEAEFVIKEQNKTILKAIRFQNFKFLESFIHPKKGLRFSPQSYFLTKDIIVSANDWSEFYGSEKELVWGKDSANQAIKMNFADYYDNYIYDEDYKNFDEIYYNPQHSRVNIVENIRRIYPAAIVVEFHINETAVLGKEWSILRLVYEQHKNVWYLVALANIKGLNSEE